MIRRHSSHHAKSKRAKRLWLHNSLVADVAIQHCSVHSSACAKQLSGSSSIAQRSNLTSDPVWTSVRCPYHTNLLLRLFSLYYTKVLDLTALCSSIFLKYMVSHCVPSTLLQMAWQMACQSSSTSGARHLLSSTFRFRFVDEKQVAA